jgi:hypothetical protein
MNETYVSAYGFNSRNDEMIESFLNSIRTRRNVTLWLDEPPEDEEFGRRVAQALTSNAHITEIRLVPDPVRNAAVRDVIQWLSTPTAGEAPTATLARFTKIKKITVYGFDFDRSLEDWDLIFRLLLTSTSLQELIITSFRDVQGDHIMSALAQYLGAATRASLRNFGLYTIGSLSEAAFLSLCDGVAGSQLRKLTLGDEFLSYFNSETAAETLARAIAESSLDEVNITSSCSLICSAILHTLPVRNLDFAISDIGIDGSHTRMKVNRLWKPLLVSATIPLALWPQILEKAHASPETSHGPVGILFHILREKPDLVW